MTGTKISFNYGFTAYQLNDHHWSKISSQESEQLRDYVKDKNQNLPIGAVLEEIDGDAVGAGEDDRSTRRQGKESGQQLELSASEACKQPETEIKWKHFYFRSCCYDRFN